MQAHLERERRTSKTKLSWGAKRKKKPEDEILLDCIGTTFALLGGVGRLLADRVSFFLKVNQRKVTSTRFME